MTSAPGPIVTDEEIYALGAEGGAAYCFGGDPWIVLFARRLLALQAERLAEMLEQDAEAEFWSADAMAYFSKIDGHMKHKMAEAAFKEAARLVRERGK